MSKYEENDLCEVCKVMEAITEVEGKAVCYRCGKKQRNLSRKGRRQEKEVRLDDDGSTSWMD